MKRQFLLLGAAAVALAGCSPSGGAAQRASHMAVNAAPAKGQAKLEVSSPAFSANGEIPKTYSAFGDRASPPLSWTAGPAGAKTYALIVQDPDAPTPRPFVHWIVFNIPAGVTAIDANTVPAGSALGDNSAASASWFAVSPPPGPAHAYHFQVFALDTTLALPEGAGRDEVVDAMKGHVLASGDLVGRYKTG
jgi:Raf kinase inhibitor-like YbhB/YbcL family protein